MCCGRSPQTGPLHPSPYHQAFSAQTPHLFLDPIFPSSHGPFPAPPHSSLAPLTPAHPPLGRRPHLCFTELLAEESCDLQAGGQWVLQGREPSPPLYPARTPRLFTPLHGSLRNLYLPPSPLLSTAASGTQLSMRMTARRHSKHRTRMLSPTHTLSILPRASS